MEGRSGEDAETAAKSLTWPPNRPGREELSRTVGAVVVVVVAAAAAVRWPVARSRGGCGTKAALSPVPWLAVMAATVQTAHARTWAEARGPHLV